MKDVVLNINGEILKYPENRIPRISVFDRSYLYGDSLYEVCRTYGGKPFGVDEHLARLEQSAQLMHMQLAQTRAEFKRQIERTLEVFKKATPREAYIRLIVSRGSGRIGFGLNTLETASLYSIIITPLELPSQAQLEQGLSMQIVERIRNDRRALDPAAKTGNYVNSLLAFLEAKRDSQKGIAADDALLLNADGHLTEGSTFNVFYVKRGIVVTPPLEIGILEGLTRRHVIRIARENKMEVRETRFPASRLFEADEVFLTSSIKEAFPITRIDQKAIGSRKHSGKPGPVTLKLRELFNTWAKNQAARS